jgi:hypothetical protein
MSARSLLATLATLTLAPLTAAQAVITPGGTPDPAYANLWAWYDADQGLNGSPTPLPHGTAVTRWDDRSIQARHLTLTSTDPTRHATAVDDLESCGPALRFDGDDYLWGSTTTIGRCIGPRTIFAVVRVEAADGGYVFDGSTATGRSTLHAGEVARPGRWHLYWGDSSQPSPNGFAMFSAMVDTARYQFHTVRIEANRQEHFVNGQLVASAAELADFNLGGLILGARYNAANGLRGGIREVLVYQESLGAIDQQLIEAYLVGRHPFGHGESYGAGCAGSGGLPPRLAVVGCPSPGRSFQLAVSDAAASSPCLVNFALGRVALPIGGGCDLLAAPVLAEVAGMTDAAGVFSFQLAVPAGLPLVAMPTQAIVVDPPVAPFGVALSNGVELRIF